MDDKENDTSVANDVAQEISSPKKERTTPRKSPKKNVTPKKKAKMKSPAKRTPKKDTSSKKSNSPRTKVGLDQDAKTSNKTKKSPQKSNEKQKVSPGGTRYSADQALSVVLDSDEECSELEEEVICSEDEGPRKLSPSKYKTVDVKYPVETNSDAEEDWQPFPDQSFSRKPKKVEAKKRRIIESDSENDEMAGDGDPIMDIDSNSEEENCCPRKKVE